MFSKKIRLKKRNKTVSVATALVLMAIDDIIEDVTNESKLVYGYQIMTHLKDSYNWNIKSGTVYPILKNLNKDSLIRKGIGNDTNTENKRQTIYYKVTLKGRKLVKDIKNLNDESLDAALSINKVKTKNSKLNFLKSLKFPTEKFSENYLSPFLLNFDKQLARLISNQSSNNEFNDLQGEIEKCINQLEIAETLFKAQISRIKTLKKINK